MLERDVRVLESRLDEDAEDVIEVIRVTWDERLAERFPSRDVGDAVDDACSLTNLARRPHHRRRGRSVEEVEDADPAGADAAEELAKEREPASGRKALEEQIRIHKIELPRRRCEFRRGLEVNVARVLLRCLAARDRKHRRRSI